MFRVKSSVLSWVHETWSVAGGDVKGRIEVLSDDPGSVEEGASRSRGDDVYAMTVRVPQDLDEIHVCGHGALDGDGLRRVRGNVDGIRSRVERPCFFSDGGRGPRDGESRAWRRRWAAAWD